MEQQAQRLARDTQQLEQWIAERPHDCSQINNLVRTVAQQAQALLQQQKGGAA